MSMIIKGQKYNELTALRELEEKKYNEAAWLCVCSCGKETIATRGQLLRGAKKSCGCLRKRSPANTIDMVGKVYGKLIVIERSGKNANDSALWSCICECGKETIANGSGLRRGDIISCGCSATEFLTKARKTLKEKHSVDGVTIPFLQQDTRSDSGSGHKGIYRRERNGKVTYEPNIAIKGKRMYLGVFNNLNDAISARKEAEIKYHDPYIKKWEEQQHKND